MGPSYIETWSVWKVCSIGWEWEGIWAWKLKGRSRAGDLERPGVGQRARRIDTSI